MSDKSAQTNKIIDENDDDYSHRLAIKHAHCQHMPQVKQNQVQPVEQQITTNTTNATNITTADKLPLIVYDEKTLEYENQMAITLASGGNF